MSITLDGTGTISGVVAGGLPDATVTQAEIASGVAGTGPAFSVYRNTNQAITLGTYTKVALNTEVFDTANAFDSTTDYRFTPQVAGYYQINGHIQFLITGICLAALYKNGSLYKHGTYIELTSNNPHSHVSDVIYLNGSTDYVELYGYTNANGNFNGTAIATYFSGALVRAA